MNFLLKNGFVIDPSCGISDCIDLFIKDGKVFKAFSSNIGVDEYKVIDCSERVVLPGFIDAHVHLRDPGFEYKEDLQTGSESALAGGITTLFCMPNTVPVIDNVSTVKYIKEKNIKHGCVNIYPVASITVGSVGEELVGFSELIDSGVIAFSDDGRWLSDSSTLTDALNLSKKHGFRIIQHCEDYGFTRDGVIHDGKIARKFKLPTVHPASEYCAVYRDICLCEMVGGSIHIAHVSTEKSINIIRDAKNRGVDVTCEVTPHHLLLSNDDISCNDAVFKVNPPLQTKSDCECLIDAVLDGTVDMIVTDHAPHEAVEKQRGFKNAPFGLIGMEMAFSVLYTKLVKTNRMSLDTVVENFSTNPAKIFGLKNKGTLADGADADITVIDLSQNYKINKDKLFSKSKNTPYHGWDVFGKITDVFVGGDHLLNNGEILRSKAEKV